jgi:hypothetical protein
MKYVAVVLVAFGLLFAMSEGSQAHEHWYHHGYYAGTVYYPAPAPVVVAPAPVYPPVVAPAYPGVVPVYPAPYYYAPGVRFGYRGHGVALGVHF